MSYNKDAAAPSHPAWESSDSRSCLPGHGQGLFPGFGFPLPHPAVLNCSCPYARFESEPTNLPQMYLEKVSPVTSLSPSKSRARNRKWKKTMEQKQQTKNQPNNNKSHQTPGFQHTYTKWQQIVTVVTLLPKYSEIYSITDGFALEVCIYNPHNIY